MPMQKWELLCWRRGWDWIAGSESGIGEEAKKEKKVEMGKKSFIIRLLRFSTFNFQLSINHPQLITGSTGVV